MTGMIPMQRKTGKRLILLSLAFALVGMDIALIDGPADGYELSVYTSMGSVFWIIVVAAILLSALGLAFYGLEDRPENNRWLVLLSLLVVTITICSLPFVRGYVSLDRHDELTHIGISELIVDSGRLSKADFYPASHMIVASASEVMGRSPLSIHLLVVPEYSVAFMLLAYCMGKALFSRKSTPMWCMVLGAVPVALLMPRYFVPTDASFVMIPLILFFQLRISGGSDTIFMRVVLCLLITSTILSHPQVCLILPIALFMIPLAKRIAGVDKQYVTNSHSNPKGNSRIIFLGGLLLWVCYIAWLQMFTLFHTSITRISITLTKGAEQSNSFAFLSYAIERPGLSYSNLVQLIINSYGMYIVLLVFFLYMHFRYFPRNAHARSWQTLFCFLTITTFLGISAFTFFGDFVMPFGRVFVYALLFLVLMMAYGLSLIFSELRSNVRLGSMNGWRRSLGFSLLIVFVILSVGSYFPSPRIGSYNTEVSDSVLQGHVWMIYEKSEKVPVVEVLGMFGRYLDFQFGPEKANEREDAIFYRSQVAPPPHFGYDLHSHVGQLYNETRYLAFDEAAIGFYGKVFPTQGSFTMGDFSRLDSDYSAPKILDTGGMVCYQILPV